MDLRPAVNYREALEGFKDEALFLGRQPNPSLNEDGNPILTLATGLFVMKLRAEWRPSDGIWFWDALKEVQSREGLWNKKPGTGDQITHDDLIGIAALSSLAGLPYAKRICQFGDSNDWVLSNTGKRYWDADVKPWHRAFYRLAAAQDGSNPLDLASTLLLAAAIVSGAYSTDAGDLRLTWLMGRSVAGKSSIVDRAFAFWKRKIFAPGAYGSAQRILVQYYGESYPIAAYCPE